MTPGMMPCQNHCLTPAGDIVAAAILRLKRTVHSSIHQCVRIDYRDGVLVLRGQARSYYHKQLIQEAVRGIEGVEDIVNAVDVTDSMP